MTKSVKSGREYPFECRIKHGAVRPEIVDALKRYGDFYSIMRKRGVRGYCFLTQEARDLFAEDYKEYVVHDS